MIADIPVVQSAVERPELTEATIRDLVDRGLIETRNRPDPANDPDWVQVWANVSLYVKLTAAGRAAAVPHARVAHVG